MESKLKNWLLVLLMAGLTNAYGQVSLVSVFVNPGRVVPKALCEASVMNTSQKTHYVNFSAALTNSQNQLILKINLLNIAIRPGLNSIAQLAGNIDQVQFGNSLQSEFVRTKYMLPSGKFRICCYVVSVSGDDVNDELCDEIESEFNSFLTLVYPPDKDTLFTPYPVLMWNHSLPFEKAVNTSVNYRMIVAKIENGQKPEQSILSNRPVFRKDLLETHQVQYPYGATELVPGYHYAWQVQLLENGIMTERTETWEFILAKDPEVKPNKYATLRQSSEAGFYSVTSDLLYFKFDEQYSSDGNLTCAIYDNNRNEIIPVVTDDRKIARGSNVKKLGDNRFEINLGPYHLKEGLYNLEIRNEKSEIYYLKFNITL